MAAKHIERGKTKMLTKKIAGALMIAMVASVGCSLSFEVTGDITESEIKYFRDIRTDQCFAAYGTGSGRTMTWVPCEPVKKFLDNP